MIVGRLLIRSPNNSGKYAYSEVAISYKLQCQELEERKCFVSFKKS
jgi:hypothetical protein